MGKKPKKDELIQQQPQPMTTEMIMSHPVVKEMAARLENVQNLLKSLPEAIGRAVAEASAIKPPMPPPAPGQQLTVVHPPSFKEGDAIELRPQQMTVGGKSFELPKPKTKR